MMRSIQVGVGMILAIISIALVVRAAPVAKAATDFDARFVGTWKLLSFHTYPTDGDLVNREMSGQIYYDAAGNMAAQLMPDAETEERVTPGYVAYFGTYTIDDKAGTVTHSVSGSNFSRWVNTDLVRHFDFANGQLTLSLKEDGRTTGALVWALAN